MNRRSAELMASADDAYRAKWYGSDASGTLGWVFPDSAMTICRLGYVTHELSIHRFDVRDCRCTALAS